MLRRLIYNERAIGLVSDRIHNVLGFGRDYYKFLFKPIVNDKNGRVSPFYSTVIYMMPVNETDILENPSISELIDFSSYLKSRGKYYNLKKDKIEDLPPHIKEHNSHERKEN